MERLSRSRDGKGIYWDIENEYLDPNALSSFDAVISLAGQNIFTRWTSANMLEITSSRVKSARTINKAIAAAPNPPKVFLCASAVGYYGLNPNYTDENSPGGEGFLAEVCRQWEKASNLLPTSTRVVNMRFGLIIFRSIVSWTTPADFLQSLQKRSIGTFARFLATALSFFRGLPLPICAARWNLPLRTGRLKARSISLPHGRAPIWNWRAQARI